MHTTLIIVSCLLTLAVAAPDYCPKPADLAPCTCDGEGFNCRKAKDEREIQKAFSSRALEDTARAIYIQGTSIKRLPKAIFGKFKFTEYHIDFNQITEVESGVFKASQEIVYAISLVNNKIEKFPFRDVEGLPELQLLSLGRNKLTAVPGPMAFGRHNSLHTLDLSDNSISRIGKGAFVGLTGMRMIFLQGNKLTALESQVFNMVNHHPYLQIGLSNNSISSVAADAFGSSSPVLLDLQSNRLTSLPQKPFMDILFNKRIQARINVEGNPMSCRGCNLYQWIVQYKRFLSEFLHGFSCTNRQGLASLTLNSIGCAGY